MSLHKAMRKGVKAEAGAQAKKTSPTRESLEKLWQDELDKERVTVLAQPHRRGDSSDMADALGTFVRIYECGRECFEAGNEYYRLVYRWRVAYGIPVSMRLREGEAIGGGPRDGEKFADFQKRIEQENHDRALKIKRCENAMKCFGLPGFRAAQNLILDGVFPDSRLSDQVKEALHSLAIEMGRFPF